MPIDFEPSEDTQAVVKGITGFADKHAAPLDDKHPAFLEDEQAYLREDGRLTQEIVDDIDQLRRKSAEAGFYALAMPEEVGGGGRPFVDVALAMQRLNEDGLGFKPNVLASVEGPSHMLLAMDEDQVDRWLRPLCNAEISTGFCLTEPGAGSDVGAIQTRAEPKGDSWVIDGTKTFITNAPYADCFEVFARTSGDRGLEGISLFMVDRDQDGVEVGDIQQSIVADGLQADVRFDDVEVGPEHLVGQEDKGFQLAIRNIGLTRVMIGAMCVGLAKHCLDEAVGYAQQREAFGKPIGKKQGVSFPLADAATRIYAAENMLLNTAWQLDQGQPCIKESSMIKLYCTETLFEVADAAVQTLGGSGIMRETGLEKVFRWARMIRIPEGTSEIQRDTIAKMLGL